MQQGTYRVDAILPAAAALPVWMTAADAGNVHTQWIQAALDLLAWSQPDSKVSWVKDRSGGSSWWSDMMLWMGLTPFVERPAARGEVVLQSMLSRVRQERVSVTLVLGPDSAMRPEVLAAEETGVLDVVARGGAGSLAREAGWVGSHSVPLQAPQAVVDTIMGGEGGPLRVWSPGWHARGDGDRT